MSQTPPSKPKSLVRQITGGGSSILLINLIGAMAAYAMFALFARVMTTAEYGAYSAGFSLATLLAQLAIVGQSLLILRNLPRLDGDDISGAGHAAVQVGYGRVAIGVTIAVAGLLIAAFWTGSGYLLGAAALTPALAFADFQTHVLRGRGMIWRAFLPREVFWRGSVIVVLGIVLWQAAQIASAQGALWLCAGVLAVCVVVQTGFDPATRIWRRATAAREWRANLRTSRELWFSSTIMIAVPQLAVLTVGLMLSFEQAALFFATAKTAQVLKVFPSAMVKVSAPLLSRAHHQGDTAKMQRISRIIAVFATTAIMIIFAALVYLGPMLLGVFGPEFVAGYPVLLVVAGGYLVAGICGPTRGVMLMTDNQNTLNRIILVTNLAAIVLLPIMAVLFGTIGVALAFALSVGGWNIWVWLWIRRNLSLETSILSVLKR